MNLLEYGLRAIFKGPTTPRERLERHKAEIRKRITEAQLMLDRERRSGRQDERRIARYEREITYWNRLLERIEQGEIVK